MEDGKISKEDWQKIGKKLQRSPSAANQHWMYVLEPMLKKYHAGTLYMDLKEVLINHLVEQKLNYAQDVNWNELVQLSKFAGTTKANLRQHLYNLQIAAGMKYPELSKVELTTVAIQRYLDNTTRMGQNRNKLENQEAFIDFYVSNN